MTINVYQSGDLVRLSAEFTDIAGSSIDPTSVSLEVTDPSGNVDTYTFGAAQITKDSTGHYHCDVAADENGRFYYRWVSTGTGQAAEDGEFVVMG